MTVELDRARARFRPGVPRGGPVRLVDLEHADQLLADIYQSANWVGAIARPPYWWRARRFWHGSAPVYAVVHGARGAEDGYAVYHALNTENWFGGRRTVLVDDLVAHTPAAYAGLTRYFAELDLVDTVRFECRPCDDPLPALLVDSRAARTSQLRDETWLRIVDVPGALARCAYRGPGSVVLAVVDPIRPINTGHYRVSAQVTEPTTAPEDLTLDVAALAAVYLGGTPWWHLARAGRVVEHTHGALEVAAELFTQSSPPFSGTMF
jgi:predicted acetyltransferase